MVRKEDCLMSNTDIDVHARIDADTRDRAEKVLDAIGLSISDAICLLMRRIADDQKFPFEVRVPNAETREAIAELEAGKGARFTSVEALMKDLQSGD
jgi:DNA-damage-inducible protein J